MAIPSALGKAVKWIPIQLADGENANLPLAFVMGRLHQKVALDVEFAILSNDDSLDTLVNFVNDKGRDCLRIQRKKESGEKGQSEDEEPLVFDELSSDSRGDESEHILEGHYEEAIVMDTAKETIRRLVHSGNRPAEIETLKRYIQLYNQEFTEYDGNVDLIIRHMEDNQEIEIQKGVVKYNF